MGQLESFFNQAWSIFDVLEMNFGGDGYPLDRMLRFLTSVVSQFYPDFGTLYEHRVRAWAAERRAALVLDESES